MPLTLTSTMNTALSGLSTSQASLGVVSHNLSNVNTEGYARQELVQSGVNLGGFGSGVEISAVRRVADNILAERVTEQKSAVAYSETFREFTSNLQTIFGVPGAPSSTEKLINKMFTDFNALANAPESTSLQLNAVQDINFVVDTISTIDQQLTANATGADQQIDREITAVNDALARINELNNNIIALNVGSTNGQNSSDLEDERLRLINFVSERINVNQSNDELGRIRLTTESGRRLVDSSYVQLVRTPPTPPSTFQELGTRSVQADGSLSAAVFDVNTDLLSTGKIKALVDVRDVEIPKIRAELDELATVMVDEFNLVHSQGTSIPPLNTLTGGNGFRLSGPAADITDPNEMGVTANGLIEISVVDIATGQPITTTLAAGGGAGSINIGGPPQTLAGVAALINGNGDIGADVTASVVVDADGNSQLQVSANNPNFAIVMGNGTGSPGNTLGELGMNNILVGTDATSLAVRPDIANDPSRIATARMRASDGGVSFQDNRNIVDLAGLADREVNFDAAGGLPAKTDSLSGYFVAMSSNLAITIKDTESRLDFENNILFNLESREAEVSGVNMDEELAKLIIYQNSFQASARVISVVDEMLQTIINTI